MIVVAFINFFKILTNWGCFFLLTLFFTIVIFVFNIVDLKIAEGIVKIVVKTDFSLTSSHSTNWILLGVAYSFFFLIRQYYIYLIGFFAGFLVRD